MPWAATYDWHPWTPSSPTLRSFAGRRGLSALQEVSSCNPHYSCPAWREEITWRKCDGSKLTKKEFRCNFMVKSCHHLHAPYFLLYGMLNLKMRPSLTCTAWTTKKIGGMQRWPFRDRMQWQQLRQYKVNVEGSRMSEKNHPRWKMTGGMKISIHPSSPSLPSQTH